MFVSSLSKPVLAIVVCLALVGCKSDAERADEYFQSGSQLLDAGDTDRALIEFRNALEFESAHLPTRQAMAKLFMTQGNLRGAYGQYLAIAEQYPDDIEARRTLAELAFMDGNWEEFVNHGTVSLELSPEDPRVQAISLGLKYREASLAKDGPGMDALVAPAEALLETLPDNPILNNVLIDSYGRNGALSKALARMDVLISATPDNRQLYNRRLSLLAELQDTAGIETQLQGMITRFPGDEEVQGMLLRYYVAEQQLDKAEAFLREIADPAAEDPGLFLTLIQFVGLVRGEEAARAEIERAIAENPKPNQFKAMLAVMDFQSGAQEKAVADLEAILSTADAESAETQDIKIILARLLSTTGNQVGARRLVEEVLAQNSSNVDALKMQASWQIQADETDAAIANLRVALDTAPEDVQAMNLMYEAYMRAGETGLARDYLALAVDASGNAPEPSLRYARVLIGEERFLPAEDVLLPALRLNPNNIDLLAALGEVYLLMDDVPRATQVADTLRRIDSEQSIAMANSLKAEILNREGGTEEALQFLEDLASGENADLRARLTLLRARLSVGETADALQIAQELSAENPDSLDLKQVLANTLVAAGELDKAKTMLREITSAAPDQAVNAWQQLARISVRQGNAAEAEAVVDEALAATGNNLNIMWLKASILEQNGDIEGAIGIYETLYEQNSASVIVANNLASLLTTYRNDDESLERAWVMARRLRDTDLPAFQDTYGWIVFRRGNAEEALPYLENAAIGLPEDPIVQVHLGLVQAALGRNKEALAQMQKAVDVAGPGDTRPRIEEARAEIQRLRTLVEN